MRIVVLGAGPSGLYFALLAKKASPGHEITVLERNPPDATYGWGVVFSEETLGALRDADRTAYEQITEAFAKWNAIDIRYGGETIRSRGHVFAGIARKALLQILQRRCADLGVELEFFREVGGASELSHADLIVGADGVNSVLRRAREEAFRPSLDVHATKFVWFGTDLVLDAFTFIFRENDHGLFQVHAYPFDAHTSTFIVECHGSTWERAGLDRATEEDSIRYCEKLFADDLAGHSLLSNRSLWVSFVTVRCETWADGNVVLLGDAAHTAHFTIGSGTKLALEDAVALAEMLDRHDDLQTALTYYEMERQPLVERFQEAARESATYFETVKRYAEFAPLQFAFNLLTRSGRITHLELERRDPAFVSTVDAWFAERAGAGGLPAPAASRLIASPPLHAPFALRDRTFGNRAVLALTGEDDALDGRPGLSTEEGLRGAAASGAGLVLTEFVAVSAHGRITPGTPGLYEDDHTEAWAGTIDDVRRAGSQAVGVRLGHSGARGATRPRREGLDRPLREGSWPPLAPSNVPYARWSQPPYPMSANKFLDVTEDFVDASRRAADAGFDLLELDMSHGFLLASFLSPLTNRRTDEYGGSLENRLRYPLEVLGAVRAVWPEDRPLAVRLTAHDSARGGLGLDDGVAIARVLREHGCDLIEPVAGQTLAKYRPDYRRLFLVPLSDRIRNEAKVATVVGGGISTADEMNTVLAAGRADLCILAPR